MSLWDYARAAWRAPGVEAICLALQADHGQPPPLLLWRLWTIAEGRPVDAAGLAAAVRTAHAWQAEVIDPIRAARRALKSPPEGFDETDCAALREQVLAAELAAEKLLLDALERSATAPRPGLAGSAATRAKALSELAIAWGRPAPEALLTRLAAAL